VRAPGRAGGYVGAGPSVDLFTTRFQEVAMASRYAGSSPKVTWMPAVLALATLAFTLGVAGCGQAPPPPAPVHCGGFAGIACPGSGVCQDDPSDSCDPNHGGADCGGICTCGPNNKLCAQGLVWNGDPAVCACAPPASGATCGKNTCAAGQFCCNPSCGICAPAGGVCTQMACESK
jgi:hypothetical protein